MRIASKKLETDLFGDPLPPASSKSNTFSTFAANTKLPVHRWFRFSAGFSGSWAEALILKDGATTVLDPFAGSGTTLLAAENAGTASIGVEAHPFLFRVASAKLHRRTDPGDFKAFARKIRRAAATRVGSTTGYPDLVAKCYPPDMLSDLDALRMAIDTARSDSPEWHLVWLVLVCILRQCSPVGTAQWQYVLPKKAKKKTINPFAAFDEMAEKIAADMVLSRPSGPTAKLLLGDARELTEVPDKWANLVVTSPPYPNNYDYADATRLEMSFFKEIASWGDLQDAVRQYLVRACSQHVPERAVDLDAEINAAELDPIRDAIASVCNRLAQVRETKGGRKTYHLMVACYFHDLARVWHALRRKCAAGARVCFVVGDSAPYGVYVPVIDWLGELAVAAGFRSWQFEKTRDRNVKWKNRKHRVPLCEGRLWVNG